MNIIDVCELKENVLNKNKQEDVISLSDLINNKINAVEFFDDTYVTEGMSYLFEIAFNRLLGNDKYSNIIKLTQAMGGGKTHSLVSLGLLCKNKNLRDEIIENDELKKIENINVVSFNGRNSDSTVGIWGEIACQLKNEKYFEQYYSPLRAPGEETWVNFLKETLNGEPLLILLDELPPYFDNAEAITIGDSNLARVTATALSNLFVAISNPQLSNVVIVLSDLNASYETGSNILNQSLSIGLSTVDKESSRYSENIEPVKSNSDDIFKILQKKFFKSIADTKTIDKITDMYIKKANEAIKSGYIDIDISILRNIKKTYPFHPSLRDLFATFKDNTNFQQTRGLIRIMRDIISEVYLKKIPIQLINITDINLNDKIGLSNLKSINSRFTNAVSHDIASNSLSISEILDVENKKDYAQRVSKTILFSSMSNSINPKVGLTPDEVIIYTLQPKDNLFDLSVSLNNLKARAWYLHENTDGKIMFKSNQNIIAKINDYISSYDDSVAFKELQSILYSKFEAKSKLCYQKVKVFPPMDEINISKNQVTLVITKPTINSDISQEILDYYDKLEYKNRVVFLTSCKNTMSSLLYKVKELIAINQIRIELSHNRIASNDYQLIKLKELYIKTQFDLLNVINQTFTILKYPFRGGLKTTDVIFKTTQNELLNNNVFDSYDGEQNIIHTLLTTKKLEIWNNDDLNSLSNKGIVRKFEHRIFTQPKMLKSDIERRMSILPEWSFLEPHTLELMIEYQSSLNEWRVKDGYLEKGPFAEKGTINIEVLDYNRIKGEKKLRLSTNNVDKVFCCSTNDERELILNNNINELNNFSSYLELETELKKQGFIEVDIKKEVVINSLFNRFIGIDSKMKNISSEIVDCNIDLNIKYSLKLNKEGLLEGIKFESVPKIKGAKIRYSVEGLKAIDGKKGSSINSLDNCNVVTAIVNVGQTYSREIRINIKSIREKGYYIDETRETIVSKKESYNKYRLIKDELNLLNKYNCTLNDVELALGIEKDIKITSIKNIKPFQLVEIIDDMLKILNIKEEYVNLNINIKTFENGANFISYIKHLGKDFEYYKGGILQW